MIPVFLYKHFGGKIICTQPRRIACINIAKRVSILLNSKLGQLVGFHIGHTKCYNRRTAILFVTDGILLNYLLYNSGFLGGVRFIVLDEVHERSLDIDYILLIVK